MKKTLSTIKILSLILVLILSLTSCDFSFLENIGKDNGGDYEVTDDLPIFEHRNGGKPYFTDDEITTVAFERYSPLDSLGRCGVVMACIGKETMPKDNEERESISGVKPSGWNQAKYDIVSGGFLYHRSHLIGWQLTAENANECNLITGTEYMNTDGMLPFENMVAAYIKNTGNHVMYRVTPDFQNNNLVANGVLVEALSVEDNGKGICFCVYVYNVQPGISINYRTGASKLSGAEVPDEEYEGEKDEIPGATTYVLNTDSKKFHLESCTYAQKMSTANKQIYTGPREDLIVEGYSPCGTCKP